jgi:hypothetical protein
METEHLGNAYTTQSSNDGCVDLADVTINLDKGHIFEAEVL